MKKFNCSNAAVFILTAVLAVGFSSCVNEEYDPENINTEVTIAGEGLSLPLGSTKQLVLRTFSPDLMVTCFRFLMVELTHCVSMTP